jgi:hypothetical protein
MSLTLRNVKGSPLTYTEMDDNLTYLEGVAGATGGTGILDDLVVSGTSSLDDLVVNGTFSVNDVVIANGKKINAASGNSKLDLRPNDIDNTAELSTQDGDLKSALELDPAYNNEGTRLYSENTDTGEISTLEVLPDFAAMRSFSSTETTKSYIGLTPDSVGMGLLHNDDLPGPIVIYPTLSINDTTIKLLTNEVITNAPINADSGGGQLNLGDNIKPVVLSKKHLDEHLSELTLDENGVVIKSEDISFGGSGSYSTTTWDITSIKNIVDTTELIIDNTSIKNIVDTNELNINQFGVEVNAPINAISGGGQLHLDVYGDDTILLSNDSGAYEEAGVYIEAGYTSIFDYSTNGFVDIYGEEQINISSEEQINISTDTNTSISISPALILLSAENTTDETVANIEIDGGAEKITMKGLVQIEELILKELPTYADNAAAITGGATANQVYKTSTGELRIVV